ncbi:MAG: protoporphyrinogen/coproporphyrinogen oxidase [Elusimicrobiota bacterium]
MSAAHHLGGRGALFEREKEPGGTARSYSVDGFTFDHTGHLLHLHNDYTKKLVRRLLRGNVFECRRDAWIFSQGVYTRYPFQANLYGLPQPVIEDCVAGLWEARRRYGAEPLKSDKPLNFEEWCQRLFGAGISKHFMIPYNRKLWTVPPAEMTPEWCGSFVPQPKLEEVLAGALTDQTTAFGYNVSFLYPRRGGIQRLAQGLAEGLPGVRLGAALEKVDWRNRSALFSTGERASYSRMISTIPLPELLKRLDPFPEEIRADFERLRWTSVLNINVGVKRPKISNKSWIYFPEKKFVFYRVGFPMNFTPHVVPEGCSSMYVEIAHRPGETLSRESAWRRVRRGLEAAGVLKRGDAFPVVSFLPIRYAYVIYDENRGPALRNIFSWLERAGIVGIGRYGAWKYSFMEEAILDGKAAAEAAAGL